MAEADLKNVNVNSNINELWEVYKREHQKSYTDQSEENDRFQLFVENVKLIIEHNAKYDKGEVTFQMGINQFSDRYPHEKKHFCGVVKPDN